MLCAPAVGAPWACRGLPECNGPRHLPTSRRSAGRALARHRETMRRARPRATG